MVTVPGLLYGDSQSQPAVEEDEEEWRLAVGEDPGAHPLHPLQLTSLLLAS